MKKTTILFALLLFVVSQGAFAQRTINGKAIDGENGLPMSGVYVVVKGTTTTGTITDKDGNFTLNVPNDATIVVSFIGFKTIEIAVRNQTQFDITLEPDVQTLGDVVVSTTRAERVIPPERAIVTAMGIVRDKMSVTTSIQQISGTELVKFLRASEGISMEDALNGRIAGYYNGQIRGRTSFNLQRGPLWVVDGIPHAPVPFNRDEIESITVLKGPQVLYGSEGANGVILITTKWGK